MSKLEELINRLCPEGVEYKPIYDLIKRNNHKGKEFPKIKTVYSVSNLYGVIKANDLHTDATIHSEDTSNYTIVKKNDYVYNPSRLNIGSIGRLKNEEEGLVSPMYIVFSISSPLVLMEFFDYFISSPKILAKIDSIKEVGARFRFDLEKWKRIEIPLPPLQVQEEIVRILDTFTELETKLETELENRKKQYEYYRDKLLTFGDEVERKKIGEFAEVSDYVANGSFADLRNNVHYKNEPSYAVLIRTADYSQNFDMSKMIYIDKSAYNFLQKSKLFGGEIIINNIGAGVGTTFLCPTLPIPMNLAPNSILVKTPNNKFYYYWFISRFGQDSIQKIVETSSLPKFNKTGFRTIEVPVPPLAEQERIVAILDKFDTLCNDISQGLPREIEFRRKQYEYYRDKLLTFKRKEVV